MAWVRHPVSFISDMIRITSDQTTTRPAPTLVPSHLGSPWQIPYHTVALGSGWVNDQRPVAPATLGMLEYARHTARKCPILTPQVLQRLHMSKTRRPADGRAGQLRRARQPADTCLAPRTRRVSRTATEPQAAHSAPPSKSCIMIRSTSHFEFIAERTATHIFGS